MEKGKTLVQHLMMQVNDAIKEDETILDDILAVTGLEVIELAELLGKEEISLNDFALVYGTYKEVMNARKEEALEKGKTI